MEELAGPLHTCDICDYVTPRPDLMAKHRQALFSVYRDTESLTRFGRPADGFIRQIKYPRYCRKIFFSRFNVIFIFEIEHINAMRRDLPGRKMIWPVLK
jgi:hypothetical protein